MIEAVVWLLVLLGIIIVFGSMVYASFRAAPWLPLRSRDHGRVLKYMKGRTGTFADLGAGDARMLVDVARHTELSGIGYEISVLPYIAGLMRIIFSRTTKRTRMKFMDFFLDTLSDVDVVYCFLTPPAMKKLRSKFERELRPGARVISYSFQIPEWKPTIVDREGGGIPVFVYDR